jgi:GNAT-family acetyltransferase (TIGR03103 family)
MQEITTGSNQTVSIKAEGTKADKIGTVLTGDLDKLSASSRLIVETAFKRGISVEMIAPENGLFTLSYKGTNIKCSGSLTEKTSVIAEEICFDKYLTNTILKKAGFHVPAQMIASDPASNAHFLETHKRIVIKPLSQSLGRGISVDIRDVDEMEKIISTLSITGDETILLEAFAAGEDLRIVVINGKYTAAIHRTPPHVIGDGEHSVKELILHMNRNKEGENQIPINYETERCIEANGFTFDSILEKKTYLTVRKNANEHTGGFPQDVTEIVHPIVRKVAERVAKIIDIPVVGIDFILPDTKGEQYTIIEANSRPGLDGHEPQPVVDRFLDFLFPEN